MSELQLGLLGIGAAVIVLVLGYNKWQEWKFRKQSAHAMPQPDGDALMGHSALPGKTVDDHDAEEYREPYVAPDPVSDRQRDPDVRLEPMLVVDPGKQVPHLEPEVEQGFKQESSPDDVPGAVILDPSPVPTLSGAVSSTPVLGLIDARFDLVMEVALDADTLGGEVVDGSSRLLDGVTRLVQWEGYNPAMQGWEGLHPSQSYRQVRAGLQLVDRRGATPHAELHRFAAGMDAVALALGGRLSNVDLAQVAARAATLDATCGEVDIQVALRISAGSGGSFAGTRLRALIEANGLVLEHDGRYRRRNDDGAALFSLTRADGEAFVAEGIKTLSLSEVLLEMDVPRVPAVTAAFVQFQRLAQALADGLNAQIVDDNRRILSPAAFDAIRKQVMAVSSTLQDAGIVAGSRVAQRLFS